MKQAVGVLLLLSVAAAGVWWMLNGSGAAETEAVGDVSVAGSGTGVSTSRGPVDVGAGPDRGPPDGAWGKVAANPRPLTTAPFHETPVPTDSIEVQILGPDGAPVPNAEAHCVAWPKRSPEEAASRKAKRAAAARAGQPTADAAEGPPSTMVLWSDGEGRIRPPTLGGKVRIAAKAGRLRGQKTFSPPDTATEDVEPNVLKLKSGLAVEVVDHEGRPAADVMTQVVMDDVWQAFPGDGARCRTGRDGVASFDGRSIRSAAKLAAASMKAQTGTEPTVLLVAVVAGLPLSSCPSVAIPEKDDGPPLRLALPPTGDVEIRIFDAHGAPFAGQVDAAVFAEDDSSWKTMAFGAGDPSRIERSTVSVRSDRGVARIARVATAAKLRAAAYFADAAHRPIDTLFAGPSSGGTTSVELKASGPRLRFQGRFLDADGGPVTTQWGWLRFVDADAVQTAYGSVKLNSYMMMTVQLDDGTFEAVTELDPSPFPGGRLNFQGSYSLPSEGKPNALATRTFTFNAAATAGVPDAEGVVRLGDIRFERSQCFAEGVVVDEAGKPVAQAQVSVRRLETAEEADGSPPRFVDDYELQVSSGFTDGKGRFLLKRSDVADARSSGFVDESERTKALAAAERRLFAEADGRYCSDGVVFAESARDVRIVMQKGGGFAGSFVAGTNAAVLQDVSVSVGGPAAAPLLTNRWSERNGEDKLYLRGVLFSEKRLMPGPARIRIRHSALAEPILTVDLEIRAGEIVRDPRLKDIDLKKLMSVRTLTVVDVEGRPIAAAKIHVAGKDTDWNKLSVDAKGIGVVPASGEDPHVVVTAEGYRGAEIMKLGSDQRVVLVAEPPTKIIVRLKAGVPAPKAGLRCEVHLSAVTAVRPSDGSDADDERQDDEEHRLRSHPLRPDIDFVSEDPVVGAMGTVSTGGTFSVVLFLKNASGDDLVGIVSAGNIVVPAGVAEFTAEVTPEPSEWSHRALGIEPMPTEEPDSGGDDGDGDGD